jgi:hypothetical protein
MSKNSRGGVIEDPQLQDMSVTIQLLRPFGITGSKKENITTKTQRLQEEKQINYSVFLVSWSLGGSLFLPMVVRLFVDTPPYVSK